MQDWQMTDEVTGVENDGLPLTDEIAGVDNAGLENDGRCCKGGNWRTRKLKITEIDRPENDGQETAGLKIDGLENDGRSIQPI